MKSWDGSPSELSVLAILRMGPRNAANHLLPVAWSFDGTLTVIRPGPCPADLSGGKTDIAYRDVSGQSSVVEVVRAAAVSLWIALRRRPQFIVSFNAYPYGVIAALVGLLLRIPFQVGFVGSDLAGLAKWRWAKPLLDRAAFITGPGARAEAALRDASYSAPFTPLIHAIDISHFSPGDEERDIDVIFVGSLIELKRVNLIIKSAVLASDLHQPYRVVIVGDGPEREKLERLTHSLGIEHLVQFAGYVDDPRDYLRRARTIVLPSAREGLPFALVEAMACGAIPIATSVGDIPSLIKHGDNGVILETAGPDDIREAVSAVVSDEPRESDLRFRAVETARPFSHENAIRLWHDRIRDLTTIPPVQTSSRPHKS